jgi:erythromycin esterase-like protein
MWRWDVRTDPAAADESTLAALRRAGTPVEVDDDLDRLLARIGDARYVLLGEASHGTHEYYTWRDRISRRLIEERGFSFVAVEGDWPDCYSVNRFVKGDTSVGRTAREVLYAFERWPTWMWANQEVAALAGWLRDYNASRPAERQAGFYGLDVYSLWDSLYTLLDYLQREEPAALPAARRALRCFEPYGEDPQRYAWATRMVPADCEPEVVTLLAQVRADTARRAREDGRGDREAAFDAEQNALVIQNAEHYYRTMVTGGPESWNIRDSHMFETLERLMAHHGPDAKGIVWEHNTHIGDARATDMARAGMHNIGSLVRQAHEPEDVVLCGFGSHRGHVIAGAEWGAPMERMLVPRARPGTWEDLLHRAADGGDRLLLLTESDGSTVAAAEDLEAVRGHRAIGVVYDPAMEAFGNYVPTSLANRYDAFLYLDFTRALRPLHAEFPPEAEEVPETYPTGF